LDCSLRSLRFALGSRLVRRRSRTVKHVRSLLLTTAAPETLSPSLCVSTDHKAELAEQSVELPGTLNGEARLVPVRMLARGRTGDHESDVGCNRAVCRGALGDRLQMRAQLWRTRSTARRWTSVRIQVEAFPRVRSYVAACRQTLTNASWTASSANAESRRTRSATPYATLP
jgi:hypothetical protein